MQYMIASDIHGSFYYAQKLLAAFQREQADRLVLLGDLLYHGPRNPLPEDYRPMDVAGLLNAIGDRLLCVRGNCDADIDQMVLTFPILADYAILTWRDRLVFVTHGHNHNLDALPPIQKTDILLHGHTHVPAWQETDACLYLNPGSVSMPKENTPHGYMMMGGDAIVWKDLDGAVYHTLN